MRSVVEINPIVLAYLGDAIYEYYVRKYLIEKGISNVKDLQEQAVSYVSAESQKKILMQLIDKNILTEEEITVMKRARNSKVGHHPKHCDAITYNYSSGFEAVFGYLEFMEKKDRIEELMNTIFSIDS